MVTSEISICKYQAGILEFLCFGIVCLLSQKFEGCKPIIIPLRPAVQVVWRLNWGHVSDKCSQENTVLEDSRVFGEITCPMAVEADQVSCDWRIRVT